MSENEDADVDEGPSRRVDIELFIVHPTMSPAEITAALGIEAHIVHPVGEPRKTPEEHPYKVNTAIRGGDTLFSMN
jgi:hypothetical protein